MIEVGSLMNVRIYDPCVGVYFRTGRVVRVRPTYNEILVIFPDNELQYVRMQ